MIEARELTKSFGAVQAVRGVNFTVQPGEAVGFLGPNGAGKTTTFRMLAGTLGPDSGTIQVAEFDLFSEPIQAKRKLGYMAENAPLYPELTAKHYLHYRAELRGIARAERKAAIELAATRAGALSTLGQLIGRLSKGYRQRLALADALLGDPPVLLLDEPTAGLDPNQVLETRQLIRELSRDHAILVSTHVLSEVEATCSRAVVIDRGTVVAQGSLDELKRGLDVERGVVQIEADGGTLDAASLGVVTAELEDQGIEPSTVIDGARATLRFDLSSRDVLSKVVRVCVEGGLRVTHAATESTALDEVFARLTKEPPS